MDRFEQFSYMLFEISRYWHKLATEEMESHGLKGPHSVYLMALENNPNGITAPQLCELCRKDKADVSRTMAAMEKKGLVVKEGVHQNLYRGVFKLTEKGMELAQQVRKRATLAVKLAGKDLSDDARQVFYKSMDLIANNLRELCKDGLPPTSGHTKGDSRK